MTTVVLELVLRIGIGIVGLRMWGPGGTTQHLEAPIWDMEHRKVILFLQLMDLLIPRHLGTNIFFFCIFSSFIHNHIIFMILLILFLLFFMLINHLPIHHNSSYEFPHSSQFSQYPPPAYNAYHPMPPPGHMWPALGSWTPATGPDGWPDRLPPATPTSAVTPTQQPPNATLGGPSTSVPTKWSSGSPRDRDRDKDHRDRDRISPDRKKRSKKKKEKEKASASEDSKTLDLDTR